MAQFQCRCLRQDRWLRILKIGLIFSRITWSDSKDSKYRNYKSKNFQIHHHFWCGKKIQNTGLKWFCFAIGSYVVDQRSGDGWFFGWAKNLTISFWKRFSKFWDAGRDDCLGSDPDHPEFPVQQKGQPRGTESPERGPVSARETNSLHDLRLLSSDWRSWHRIGLCWSILFTLCGYNIQEFDTRWDEVLLSMSKISSDEILESLYKLRIRVSDQLKTVLELYDMEIHQKISVPNHKKLKTVVKRTKDQKLRLRNFDARHGRIESGAVWRIERD